MVRSCAQKDPMASVRCPGDAHVFRLNWELYIEWPFMANVYTQRNIVLHWWPLVPVHAVLPNVVRPPCSSTGIPLMGFAPVLVCYLVYLTKNFGIKREWIVKPAWPLSKSHIRPIRHLERSENSSFSKKSATEARFEEVYCKTSSCCNAKTQTEKH